MILDGEEVVEEEEEMDTRPICDVQTEAEGQQGRERYCLPLFGQARCSRTASPLPGPQ